MWWLLVEWARVDTPGRFDFVVVYRRRTFPIDPPAELPGSAVRDRQGGGVYTGIAIDGEGSSV